MNQLPAYVLSLLNTLDERPGLDKKRSGILRAQMQSYAKTINILGKQTLQMHEAASGVDAVCFRAASTNEQWRLSRQIVMSWSEPLANLVQYGNDMEKTCPSIIDIQLSATDLKKAMGLLREGVAPGVALTRSPGHPLLEFADCYEVPSLKDAYADEMLIRDPMTEENAIYYLPLGMKYKIPGFVKQAADILAGLLPRAEAQQSSSLYRAEVQPNVPKKLLGLEASQFAEVLKSDSVPVDCEATVINFIGQWAHAKYQEMPVVAGIEQGIDDLMACVRFDLFTLSGLSSLSDGKVPMRFEGYPKDRSLNSPQTRKRLRDAVDSIVYGTRYKKRRRNQNEIRQNDEHVSIAKTVRKLFSDKAD